jgi:hypothetical protein
MVPRRSRRISESSSPFVTDGYLRRNGDIRLTARYAIHLQFDISANAFGIRPVQIQSVHSDVMLAVCERSKRLLAKYKLLP